MFEKPRTLIIKGARCDYGNGFGASPFVIWVFPDESTNKVRANISDVVIAFRIRTLGEEKIQVGTNYYPKCHIIVDVNLAEGDKC